VVSKAKAANMPKDKIDAAIKRGVEGKDGERRAAATVSCGS
jgi:transcriptional/translational regulatory protein YebC/TACO1